MIGRDPARMTRNAPTGRPTTASFAIRYTAGRFPAWVSMLLSEAPGEPSVRRVALLLAVLLDIALCLLGIKYDMSKTVETLAMTLTTAAFAAVTVGRFAENGGHR